MQDSVPFGKGAMIAILGMTIEEIEKEINIFSKKNICEIANDNSNTQVVVSGEKKIIENLNENLKRKKKKGILLPVSAPFHCSLMQSALEDMIDPIKNLDILTPELVLCNNVDALFITDPEKIKDSLINQITSRVKWRESIEKIKNQGKVNQFIELGSGSVLSGLIKRIDKNLDSVALESIRDIEKFVKLV